MANWPEESLMKDEDFQDDEIWAVGKGIEESKSKLKKSEKLKRCMYSSSSSSSSSYAWTSIDGVGAPRRILKGSKVITHHQQHKEQQLSAPMRIPDWSKIYREKPKDSSDGEDEMMPPHEYINRRVARSQIAPFSMCEGVGRTLKGRDLSKLRNTILTKTGFLE